MVFAVIATGGKNLGLGTVYTKHILFHQSKLSGTLSYRVSSFFFISLYTVMQVSDFIAELGLESELVDRIWKATTVPDTQ